MTGEQLELLPAPPRLRPRQARALALIRANQPLASADLGRLLGAKPGWESASGREVGAALRRKRGANGKPLVRYSRKHGGWVTADYQLPPEKQLQGELPEGF